MHNTTPAGTLPRLGGNAATRLLLLGCGGAGFGGGFLRGRGGGGGGLDEGVSRVVMGWILRDEAGGL